MEAEYSQNDLFSDPSLYQKFDGLIERTEQSFGPIVNNDGEIVKVNLTAIAYIISLLLNIVYCKEDDTLWIFDQHTGLWLQIPEDLFCAQINAFLIKFFKTKNLIFGFKAKSREAKEILLQLKNFTFKRGFFDRKPQEYIVHCQNCFLTYDIEQSKWIQRPLNSPDLHSRNQLNVIYNPDAKAPLFLDNLLRMVLAEDDIRVFFDYIGQVFLGWNLSQTILIISGDAGSGKSTAVNIAEKLVGEDNATELRTGAMRGYFEIGRYQGKTLLIGRDVPADFLQTKGAEYLKKLTGGDNVVVERKHSNYRGSYRGNLNVIVISNTRQPIRIEGDRDAWERRVRTIQFHAPEIPIEPIRDFDVILAKEEGSGIFNLALQGLTRVIQAGGKLEAGERQHKQIIDLLDESQSVKVFLRDRVELGDSNKENMTTMELYKEYSDYCVSRGWDPLPLSKAAKQFPDEMASAFKVERSTQVSRNGTNKRGYLKIRLKKRSNDV